MCAGEMQGGGGDGGEGEMLDTLLGSYAFVILPYCFLFTFSIKKFRFY